MFSGGKTYEYFLYGPDKFIFKGIQQSISLIQRVYMIVVQNRYITIQSVTDYCLEKLYINILVIRDIYAAKILPCLTNF